MAEIRKRRAGAPEEDSAPVSGSAVKPKVAVEPVAADWFGLSKYERYVPWVLLAIAAFTRFYRLDQPPGVVFGEAAAVAY